MNAELERKSQDYAQHLALMQQSAAQHISMSEQQSIRMQYEIGRIKFEMDDLRRQLPAQNITSSSRSEASGGAPERNDLQLVRRSLSATLAASMPRESDRHLWESLQRNRGPQAASAEEQGNRGSTPSAGGDPGSEERQGRTHSGGDRMPDRGIRSMPAPDAGRNQHFVSAGWRLRRVPEHVIDKNRSRCYHMFRVTSAATVPTLEARAARQHGERIRGSWRRIRVDHGEKRRGRP